jgi:hypothetical protein
LLQAPKDNDEVKKLKEKWYRWLCKKKMKIYSEKSATLATLHIQTPPSSCSFLDGGATMASTLCITLGSDLSRQCRSRLVDSPMFLFFGALISRFGLGSTTSLAVVLLVCGGFTKDQHHHRQLLWLSVCFDYSSSLVV